MSPIKQDMSEKSAAPRWWNTFSAAPHRLFFATGMWQLAAISGWWLAVTLARAMGSASLEPLVPGVIAHGGSMLYVLFTPFIMGFLLTVFPRWQPAPQIPRTVQLLVFFGLNAGQLLALAGLYLHVALLVAGLVTLLFAWTLFIGGLLVCWLQATQRAIHSATVLSALVAGFAGLLLLAHGVLDANWSAWPLIRSLGLWGFLVPVFFSVCHRMVPFFSSRVVPGYTAYRPAALLYLVVAASVARAMLEQNANLAWAASTPLALATAWLVWKWWPRSRHGNGLLSVLHFSCLWLALGIALQSAQDISLATTGTAHLGRIPLHALGIGFFGGMMLSMVTRVTLGHSGRPLALDRFTWGLFLLVQVSVGARIVGELIPQAGLWMLAAALAWAIAFVAWVFRYSRIYTSPRVDGIPG